MLRRVSQRGQQHLRAAYALVTDAEAAGGSGGQRRRSVDDTVPALSAPQRMTSTQQHAWCAPWLTDTDATPHATSRVGGSGWAFSHFAQSLQGARQGPQSSSPALLVSIHSAHSSAGPAHGAGRSQPAETAQPSEPAPDKQPELAQQPLPSPSETHAGWVGPPCIPAEPLNALDVRVFTVQQYVSSYAIFNVYV